MTPNSTGIRVFRAPELAGRYNCRGVDSKSQQAGSDQAVDLKHHYSVGDNAMKTLFSREPWWAKAPQPGQADLELEWGYLVIYQVDGGFEFEFDQTRPSDEEIGSRKGCRISGRSFDTPGSGHVE